MGVTSFAFAVLILLGASIAAIAFGLCGLGIICESTEGSRGIGVSVMLTIGGAVVIFATMFGLLRVLWEYLRHPRGEDRDFDSPWDIFMNQFNWLDR